MVKGPLLKELILKSELQNEAVYGFIDSGISSGKEAFLELITMAKDNIKLSLQIEKSMVSQKIELDGESLTLYEASQYISFYREVLSSSLKNQYPELYQLAMEDYLELNSKLEMYLVTHGIKNDKKKKSSTQDS